MKKYILLCNVVVWSIIGVLHIGRKSADKHYANILDGNIEALSQQEIGCSNSWTCYVSLKKGAGCYKCATPCIWKKIKIHPLQNRITQANVSDRRIIFTCYSFTYGIFIRSTMNIGFDLHRGNV